MQFENLKSQKQNYKEQLKFATNTLNITTPDAPEPQDTLRYHRDDDLIGWPTGHRHAIMMMISLKSKTCTATRDNNLITACYLLIV